MEAVQRKLRRCRCNSELTAAMAMSIAVLLATTPSGSRDDDKGHLLPRRPLWPRHMSPLPPLLPNLKGCATRFGCGQGNPALNGHFFLFAKNFIKLFRCIIVFCGGLRVFYGIIS
jgi:hypothetical protein